MVSYSLDAASGAAQVIILSIDPGPNTSGVVRYDTIARRVLFAASKMDNYDLLKIVQDDNGQVLGIEYMANQGRAQVGASTFDAQFWGGRFAQAWHSPDQVRLITRRRVLSRLCISTRDMRDGSGKKISSDTLVRQRLIAMLGEDAVKGVDSHAWSALGVAVAC